MIHFVNTFSRGDHSLSRSITLSTIVIPPIDIDEPICVSAIDSIDNVVFLDPLRAYFAEVLFILLVSV